MKSFRLSSSVTIKEYKDFRVRGKTSVSSFKAYTLSTEFKAGGLTDFRLKAGVFDSSNMRLIAMEVKKKKVERFTLAGKISESNTTKYFTVTSRVKINNFEANTIISRIGISKVSSFKLKVKVSKTSFAWKRLKSLTKKRGYSIHVLEQEVLKLGREHPIYFMLKNSTSTYMPPESGKRNFDSLTSEWTRLTVTNQGIPAIRSVSISFSVEELDVIPSLLSRPYVFKKAPLRDFTGIRAFASKAVVSVRRGFDTMQSPYIRLTGTFATLSPVRSNPIFFSISREIVDFQLNDTTALSLNLVMTKLDTRVPQTQMIVDFGDNLFRMAGSRFRRIINPFVDKEEDNSFLVGSYRQKYLLDYKPNKYTIEELSTSSISTEINGTHLPFKIKGRSVPEIFFSKRTAYRIRLKKETGNRKIISSPKMKHVGSVSNLEDVAIEVSGDSIVLSRGRIPETPDLDIVKIKELYGIEPFRTKIITGKQAVNYSPPGEVVIVETVVEDSDGVPIGVESKSFIQFNGEAQSFPVISFKSKRERFDREGIKCWLFVPLSTNRIPIIEPLVNELRLRYKTRHDLDGLKSPKQSFNAVFTTDIDGSISAKNRFTANLWANLSPLRYELKLRIAV